MTTNFVAHYATHFFLRLLQAETANGQGLHPDR